MLSAQHKTNETHSKMETLTLIEKHQLTFLPLPRSQGGGYIVGVFGDVSSIDFPGYIDQFEGTLWCVDGYLHQSVKGNTLLNAVTEWVRLYGN